MTTRVLFRGAVMLFSGVLFSLMVNTVPPATRAQTGPTIDQRIPQYRRSIEDYRKAIKDAYRVDIANFKERLKGGRADGKPITNYNLTELLEGIRFEREHTDDSLLALEMAMDHLETIPDYYSRLHRLEKEVMSDKLLDW